MYQDIRSCVTVNGECSDFFSSYMGVRQGENVSPMLFSIFMNDLEKHLSENGCEQLNFNDAQIAKISGDYYFVIRLRRNCKKH